MSRSTASNPLVEAFEEISVSEVVESPSAAPPPPVSPPPPETAILPEHPPGTQTRARREEVSEQIEAGRTKAQFGEEPPEAPPPSTAEIDSWDPTEAFSSLYHSNRIKQDPAGTRQRTLPQDILDPAYGQALSLIAGYNDAKSVLSQIFTAAWAPENLSDKQVLAITNAIGDDEYRKQANYAQMAMQELMQGSGSRENVQFVSGLFAQMLPLALAVFSTAATGGAWLGAVPTILAISGQTTQQAAGMFTAYNDHLERTGQPPNPFEAAVIATVAVAIGLGGGGVSVHLAKRAAGMTAKEATKAATRKVSVEIGKALSEGMRSGNAETLRLLVKKAFWNNVKRGTIRFTTTSGIEGFEEMVEGIAERGVEVMYGARDGTLSALMEGWQHDALAGVMAGPMIGASAVGGAKWSGTPGSFEGQLHAAVKQEFHKERSGLGADISATATAVRDDATPEVVVREEATEQTEDVTPEGVAVTEESVSVEDVTPADVVAPTEGAEVTVADLDNDEWADRAIEASADAVDSVVLTKNGNSVRANPPGKENPLWKGIIPEGVSHTKTDRRKIFDRLVAARERRASAAAAVESGAEVAVEQDTGVTEQQWEPLTSDMGGEDSTRIEAELEAERVAAREQQQSSQQDQQEVDSLLAEQRRLETLLDETDPNDELFDETATQLGMVEGALTTRGIEFSRVMTGRERGRIDSSELEEEPGTQRGTAPGGFATDTRTDERKYTKRYPTERQAQDEVVANRLYDAAGVAVPTTELLIEDGEVVGVVSTVVEGLTPGVASDTGEGVVIDAWLANWDVVGEDGTNLTVGSRGEAVRLDQGGALRSRAQGEPKGDKFGDTVGEIDTLREQNPELASASPAQLQRGFDALSRVTNNGIKRIVKENSTGDTEADNKLIKRLIKRRADLLSRRSEIVDDKALSESRAELELEVEEANERYGTEYSLLTDEEIENLTGGEREIAENMRKRFGREIVFVASRGGVVATQGWVSTGNNPDTIVLLVSVDSRSRAATVAKERGMSERDTLEAYESVLIQTLIHENVHHLDDTSAEGVRLRSASDGVLKHIASERRTYWRVRGIKWLIDEEIEAVDAELKAGEITEEHALKKKQALANELKRETTAESLSDMYALSQSGIEVLFLDKGLIKNTISRLRMLASRIGGPKDVRIVTRVVKNMERGNGFVPANPNVRLPGAILAGISSGLSEGTEFSRTIYTNPDALWSGWEDDKNITNARQLLELVAKRSSEWKPLANALVSAMDEESLATEVKFAKDKHDEQYRANFALSDETEEADVDVFEAMLSGERVSKIFPKQGRITLSRSNTSRAAIHEAIHGATLRKFQAVLMKTGMKNKRFTPGQGYLDMLQTVAEHEDVEVHVKNLISAYLAAVDYGVKEIYESKVDDPLKEFIAERTGLEGFAGFRSILPFGVPDEVQNHLPYGLGNIDEFVAEALSSEDFQRFLRGIPIPRGLGGNRLGKPARGVNVREQDWSIRGWGSSLFGRVIDAIKGMMGITGTPSDTLMDEVLIDATGVMGGRIGTEFSRVIPPSEMRRDLGPIPYMDLAIAKANPYPENLLMLLVVNRAVSGKPTEEKIRAALKAAGFTARVKNATVKYIRENYLDTKMLIYPPRSSVSQQRSEDAPFGPAGMVERAMDGLFDVTPIPTAEQLSKMPGAPKPRGGVSVVKMKVTEKQPWSQRRQSTFVRNVKSTVKVAKGKVAETEDINQIDALLKVNDVVIYVGEGGPAVHANQSWTDRFAHPTDYAGTVEMTKKALEGGFVNWYRQFGAYFFELGGEQMVNEAAFVFGVTSAQNSVENNIADTLHLMRLVREHRRDGKPWTKAALMKTLFPVRGPKDKGDTRRTKWTSNKTARPLAGENQIKRIVDFYIDGVVKASGTPKTLFYSASIAAGARNNFNPFSVQDRHQAAMYGFFRGSFNGSNGKFNYDKVISSELGYRYAAYLTGRLSMESGIAPMSVSQVQAAQWFFTKAGEGPYPELEAKEDKGLLANFGRDNDDITTGTLESAIRFAEFEIADFKSVMESLSDEDQFPARDYIIPSFNKMLSKSLDYTGGQVASQDLSPIMAREAPRFAIDVSPEMDVAGLRPPSQPLPAPALDAMISSLINSVTESDGTIRLFNDMGLPHMPLVSLEGTTNGVAGRSFVVTPLVGSITNPVHARVMGSVLGMGLMLPRVAAIRQTPDGASVTLRLHRDDGEAFTDDDIFAMAPFTARQSGEGEVWMMTSPDRGFVDVTMNPSAKRVSDEAAEAKFKKLIKGVKNATGTRVEADLLRTEVEQTRQENYQEVIEGSGLGIRAEGQSSVLRRVLAEVTSPSLSVLRTNGFGFNRAEFQSSLGVSEDVVQDLPIEFSRVMPVMPLAEASELRRDIAGLPKFRDGKSTTSEIEAAELTWWARLTSAERWSVGFWQSANLHWFGTHDSPESMSFPQAMRDIRAISTDQRDEYGGGHKYLRAAALAEFGSWDWSRVWRLEFLLDATNDSDMPSDLKPGAKQARDEIKRALIDGIKKAEAQFKTLGYTMDYGESLTESSAGFDYIVASIETTGSAMSGLAEAVAMMHQPQGGIDSLSEADRIRFRIRLQNILLSHMQAEMERTAHPGNEAFDYLAKVYNKFMEAVAKAPVFEGTVTRSARKVDPDQFAKIFPVGSRFRTAAPASASTRPEDSQQFMSGWSDEDTGESFFIIKGKTSRLVNMETTLRGRERLNQDDRGINMTYREVEDRIALLQIDEDGGVDTTARLKKLLAARAEFFLKEDPNASPSEVDAQEMYRRLVSLGEVELANDWISREHGAWDTFSLIFESEVVLMPGTVYEVVSHSKGTDDSSAFATGSTIKEVDVTEEEAKAVPIVPEFSRVMPPSSSPVQSITTPTNKTIRWQTGVKGRTLDYRTFLQDRFIRLDYIQRDIEEAYGHVPLESDPLNRLRNLPGIITHKATRFQDRFLKPILSGVTKTGLTHAQFGEYAGAVHALDVNADMRAKAILGQSTAPTGTIDSGLTDADAQAIINRIKQHENFNEIEALRKQLVMIGRQNLSIMLRSGLTTQEEYDRLLLSFPNYIPFNDPNDPEQNENLEEKGEQFYMPVHLLSQRVGRTAGSLKDNEAFWRDRINAMADMRYRVIRKSEQNMALQRLLRLSDDIVDDENVFERVDPPLVHDTNGKLVPDRNWLDRDPQVIRIMVDGTPVYLKLKNTVLAKAIRSRNVPQTGWVRKLVGMFTLYTRYKRFYATQFGNPSFTVGNPVRDVQTGGATIIGDHRNLTRMTSSERRKISIVDRVRILAGSSFNLAGAWAAMWGAGTPKTKRQLRQYLALGARQGFFEAQGPDENRRAADLIIKQATPFGEVNLLGKAGKTVRAVTLPLKKFVEFWGHINTMFDDGVRFAAYKSLVARGVEREKAVEITRDLTVDFARMGTGGRSINAMYAFANASAQGSVKTLRLLKSKSGASVFTAYVMAGVMTELLNDQDKDCDGNLLNDWDEIPDYERDANIMIPWRNCEEDGESTYMKIPVAYGLAIPYVFGRRLVRMLKGKDTIAQGALATMTATYSNLNPLGGETIMTEDVGSLGVSAGRLLSPDMIDPLLSLMGNQDWLGRGIYHTPFPTDKGAVRSHMGKDSTAKWSKDLSEFVNTLTGGDDVQRGMVDVQPEILPYLLGDVFSGAWRTGEKLGEYFQQQWIEDRFPGEGLSKKMDVPGLDRFFTRTAGDARPFYQYRDEALLAKKQIKEYDETGRPEMGDAKFDEARAVMSADDFYKEVKGFKKEKREALQYLTSQNASYEEKHREAKYWDDLIKAAQKDAVIAVRREEQAGG